MWGERSANQDPIFSQYSLPSGNEPGYPGGAAPAYLPSRVMNLEH